MARRRQLPRYLAQRPTLAVDGVTMQLLRQRDDFRHALRVVLAGARQIIKPEPGRRRMQDVAIPACERRASCPSPSLRLVQTIETVRNEVAVSGATSAAQRGELSCGTESPAGTDSQLRFKQAVYCGVPKSAAEEFGVADYRPADRLFVQISAPSLSCNTASVQSLSRRVSAARQCDADDWLAGRVCNRGEMLCHLPTGLIRRSETTLPSTAGWSGRLPLS